MMFVQHFLFDQVLDGVAFDQILRPIILLDTKMLRCFAALPTKLCPESTSDVRASSQSRIAILFSSLGFSIMIICNKDGGQGSTAGKPCSLLAAGFFTKGY